MMRGWASPFSVPTGLFIRDYLLKHGEGYAQEIWRALKKERAKLGLSVSSYNTFYNNYIRILRKLGLITEVRREPSSRPYLKQRVYFKITPGCENDPRWRAPQAALHPTTRLGKHRYKKLRRYAEAKSISVREAYNELYGS